MMSPERALTWVTYTSRAVRKEVSIDLELRTRTEGAWTILEVVGEVDLYTAPALHDRLVAMIDGGTRSLAVDLQGVGFMDSSGLGVLVGGLKRLRENGGQMSLVCREGSTLKVLTVTGLDRVFPIHATVADATAS